MTYPNRKEPLFSACGLNCGLCPRYHTVGVSRCPGCGGVGFSLVHPNCGVLNCALRKGIEFCFLCEEFPCKKYDKANSYDSFISHYKQMEDLAKAKAWGIAAYSAEQKEKIAILEFLLNNFNDGRQKSFYCLAVSLFDLATLKTLIKRCQELNGNATTLKERITTINALFLEEAQKHGLVLKLRKKLK